MVTCCSVQDCTNIIHMFLMLRSMYDNSNHMTSLGTARSRKLSVLFFGSKCLPNNALPRNTIDKIMKNKPIAKIITFLLSDYYCGMQRVKRLACTGFQCLVSVQSHRGGPAEVKSISLRRWVPHQPYLVQQS